jgi:hypothetical protein
MGLIEFVAAESAQVWMLHRTTGEPVHIPDGGAEPMKPHAAKFRCPFDDCNGPISLIAPTRARHHFRHHGDRAHAAGTEGVFHVEAKMMMAQWFRERGPTGTRAVLESVPSGTSRRADALVHAPGRPQLAVEVEYKAFSTVPAETKDADYRSAGVDCLWLLGHTHLRDVRDNVATVPWFAARLRARGARILVVNPTTRQIGALDRPSDSPAEWDGSTTSVRVFVFDLAECVYDASLLVRTPLDTTLDELAIARRAEAAKLEELARREAEDRCRRESAEAVAAQRLRAEFLSYAPGTALAECLHVAVVTRPSPGDHALGTEPTLWRAAIFAECVAGRANWATFTWRDIRAAMRKHHVATSSRWSSTEFDAVRGYLHALEDDGWVFILDSRQFAASGKHVPPAPH